MQKIRANISPLQHNGATFIKVDIPNNTEAKSLIRSINGRKWSQTHRCWYIPNSYIALEELKQHFEVTATVPVKKVQSSQSLQTTVPVRQQLIQQDKDSITPIGSQKVITGTEIRIEKASEKWIRAFVPYDKNTWINHVRDIPGRKWSPEGKYWLLPYVQDTLNRLDVFIGKTYLDYTFPLDFGIPLHFITKKKVNKSKYILHEYQKRALIAFEEKLMLQGRKERTIKVYKNCLKGLFLHYPKILPSKISKKQIEAYIIHRKRRDNISDSTQNQLVNGIKSFYLKVLNQTNKVIELDRPVKRKKLPNVLSENEVVRLLQSVENLKHKCLLILIYSAGLRRSEVLNLRVNDLNFSRKTIFIKNGKGGKDRYTLFSDKAIGYVRAYKKMYQPKYWLFQGQKGGKYSETSLQSIFEQSREKSGVNPQITLHGLRHSFATHLVERGVPLHVIKQLLGHEHIKTTEIYLHISSKYMQELKSPLDNLDI